MEPHVVKEDDAWVEGRSLLATVEDVELIDPDLSSEQLLYRLFHERGVRVYRAAEVRAECSCSRAGVETMLRNFSQDDRDHMVENGKISVTCEFCSANYVFAPEEVADADCTGSRSLIERARGVPCSRARRRGCRCRSARPMVVTMP